MGAGLAALRGHGGAHGLRWFWQVLEVSVPQFPRLTSALREERVGVGWGRRSWPEEPGHKVRPSVRVVSTWQGGRPGHVEGKLRLPPPGAPGAAASPRGSGRPQTVDSALKTYSFHLMLVYPEANLTN